MNSDKKKYKNNIISFSGRKESGKTELANICTEFGYEKKSFATALKELVRDILGFDSIEDLNSMKLMHIGVSLDSSKISKISEKTGIEYEFIDEVGKKITEDSTGRDWLQIIGTDIIRAKNPEWHVNKTLETIQEGHKYVFDDTRFENELKALRNIGAECWFIIRNKTDNISNHISETSLGYQDFNYNVIVNNITLETFRKRWKCFLEYHDITMPMRSWLMSSLFMNSHIPMSEHVLHKLYIYKEFRDLKKIQNMEIPGTIIQNDGHNGFIGDDGNPFIMETWKNFYNSATSS
jgi:hypothetical protein